MSKTYVLLDINHTLLDDNKALNTALISSLLEHNLNDVYLFTEMTFSPSEIIELKQLLKDLNKNGLTVHGVLSTADLFWGVDHQELIRLPEILVKHNINPNTILTDNQIEILEQEKLVQIVSALREKKYCTRLPVGAAAHEIETSDIFQRANAAKCAANLLSSNLPGSANYLLYHPKMLLMKLFVDNKPADCTSCIIFDSNESVYHGVMGISQELALPMSCNLMDSSLFHYSPSSRKKRYDSFIKNFYTSDGYIISAGESDNIWLSDEVVSRINEIYSKKRGFKLFGFSSDESLLQLKTLSPEIHCDIKYKQASIEYFLRCNTNKGKRLYDILIEEKIKFMAKKLQNVADSDSNHVWLTDDILYLINQKYKQNRGFKILGYSCKWSINLLDTLSRPASLSLKQQAIMNYLDYDNCKGKRLFIILTDIKNMVVKPVPPVRVLDI